MIRLYFSDWQVLALIKLRGYGYNADIAQALKKTRRAISYTLSKLTALNLIERVGNPRCPFQWFQLNPQEKERAGEFIKYLGTLFSLKTFNKNCCLLFDPKDFYVPSRTVFDPSRPWGFSISWEQEHFFQDLHKALKKMFPHHSLKPPDVVIIKHGRGTFQIGVDTGRAGWRFYWASYAAWLGRSL